MAKQTVELKPTLTNEIQRKKLASGVMKNALTIGTKKLAWIPVELLNIQAYQRSRQRHVSSIAENWDDAKCNVLLASYDEENGCFNVMDGQHRAAAARMRGVEYLVCEIFSDMTISKEAAMFVDANITTKKLNPFDTYKANQYITEEDETELSKLDKRIASVCEKYDVKVAKTNGAGALKSVPVVRSIMKRDGEDGLEFVFSVIKDSQWDTFKNGFSSDLVESLGRIYFANKNNIAVIKSRLCGFFLSSSPDELEALGNNNYPNLGRRGRLNAILADIINEPQNPTPMKKRTLKTA